MTLTMQQIEREAERHIRELYAKHGITRPVPPARLGAQLGAKARANVDRWLDRMVVEDKECGDCWRTRVPSGVEAYTEFMALRGEGAGHGNYGEDKAPE